MRSPRARTSHARLRLRPASVLRGGRGTREAADACRAPARRTRGPSGLASPLNHRGRTPPAPRGRCEGGPGLTPGPGHSAPVRAWSPEFKPLTTRRPGAEKAGVGGTEGSPVGPPASPLLVPLLFASKTVLPGLVLSLHCLTCTHSPSLLLGLCSLLFKHSWPSVIPGSSRTPALGAQTASSLLPARTYPLVSTCPTRLCPSAPTPAHVHLPHLLVSTCPPAFVHLHPAPLACSRHPLSGHALSITPVLSRLLWCVDLPL